MTERETPLNIPILYLDKDLLVCVKPAGMPTQADPGGEVDLLTHLQAEQGELYLIHRLDRGVGGVLVFARNRASAASLSREVQDHGTFQKQYLAITDGVCEGQGEMTDLLYHDRRLHKAFPVERPRNGVKEARLTYTALAHTSAMGRELSLVSVTLGTGRFHQIRVQFASRRLPLLGDGKYGSRVKCPLALWAYRLSFLHPVTGERLNFCAPPPPTHPWTLFELPQCLTP
jgi:23S rRNA pseudouridine1911/1915/1917 synthase